ncbi:MAG TPA: FG-GAP-like repeat-containing protein [Terriglobales bacterium]
MNSAAIAVADVNGDGKPDIVVGNAPFDSSESSVGVLLGNGDGTFQSAKAYGTGGHPMTVFGPSVSIAVADVNGDGRPDVLVGQLEGVAVLLGNGDGSFQGPLSHPINSLSGVTPVAADVNADGHPDLLALFCGGGALGVLLGNGDGTFGALQLYRSGGDEANSIVVSDVNRDGKVDLLVNNGLSDAGFQFGKLGVLLGNGDGTFQQARIYNTGGFSDGSLTVADVNGDGNPDVITVNFCESPYSCLVTPVSVLLGNGDGTFQTAKIRGSGGKFGEGVAVADINRDGIPDLLTANQCWNSICDRGSVQLLLGRGDGTFVLTGDGNIPGSPDAFAIAIADVNGDGTADVFVAKGDGIGVLLSLFSTTTNVTSGLNPSVYGQAVTLNATVETNGPVAPTGTVRFMNGKVMVGSATVSENVATLTTSHLPAGRLSLTARYQGDELSAKSGSAAISQTITPATTVTVVQSSLNPSVQGQLVRFTATATSPTTNVVGTVTFTAGTTTLGTVALGTGGKARFSTSALPHGQTKVTATYNGTNNISGSAASLIQTVN